MHRFIVRHSTGGVRAAVIALATVSAAVAQPSAPSAASTAPLAEATETAAAPVPSRFDVALGAVLGHGPRFAGSARQAWSLQPVLYARWGRVAISTGAGFVSRNRDDVQRGLSIDLSRRPDLDVDLSLRFEAGRDTGDEPELRGAGETRATVRARLSADWTFAPRWRLQAAWAPDLLGHGNGSVLSAGLAHDLSVGVHRWTASATLNGGDGTYVRSLFGVDAEASALSGHPRYRPGAGVVDLGLALRWRTDVGRRWSVTAATTARRLLGDAARSPLTPRDEGFGVSAGMAYRF